jgi:hypothetical protein
MLKIKDSNVMLTYLKNIRDATKEAIEWASTIGRYKDEIEKKAIHVRKNLALIDANLLLANLQLEYVDDTPIVLSAGPKSNWKEIKYAEYYSLIKTSDQKPIMIGQGCYWKRDGVMIARCDSHSFYRIVPKYSEIQTSRFLGA